MSDSGSGRRGFVRDVMKRISAPGSRDEPGGQPAAPFQPLDATWFTMNEEAPRSDRLPERNRGLFRRAEEFKDHAGDGLL